MDERKLRKAVQDETLRKLLHVLIETVAEVKAQTNSNTERITAMETAVRSVLSGAPQQFEQFLATTLDHARTLSSKKDKVSEFETIRQILDQSPEG